MADGTRPRQWDNARLVDGRTGTVVAILEGHYSDGSGPYRKYVVALDSGGDFVECMEEMVSTDG